MWKRGSACLLDRACASTRNAVPHPLHFMNITQCHLYSNLWEPKGFNDSRLEIGRGGEEV